MANGNGNGSALVPLKPLPTISEKSTRAELMTAARRLKSIASGAYKGREFIAEIVEVGIEGGTVFAGGAIHGFLESAQPEIDIPFIGKIDTWLLASTAIGLTTVFAGKQLGRVKHTARLLAYGIGAGEASLMAKEAFSS